MKKKYDLIVIGSGPAGEKAAVKAAYFGKEVALIEREHSFGGTEVITGTLPSKTLKETALFLSGKYEKGLFGIERKLEKEASIEAFMYRKNLISKEESSEVFENLKRHHVDLYKGTATFKDANTVIIEKQEIEADYIIIATGSHPFHPENIPFDGKRIHDSDSILTIEKIPESLCILGAGVIGCEYATIFATMGTKVTLINNQSDILSHIDREVTNELLAEMKENNIDILFNESVEKIDVVENGPLNIHLKSQKTVQSNQFLITIGRVGNTSFLNLKNAGIEVDQRGRIPVNQEYCTKTPNIFAVGDVIGFPSLASTSMEQGRVAVAQIFQTEDLKALPQMLPYGLYTIPEVGMVGMTEQEAEEKKIPHLSGKCSYGNLPRGKILGTKNGFLKIVFHKENLSILGIHIIGPLATELIHYGMELVENQRDLYYLIGRIFNYPTLHDLYKYAAYDGLSVLKGRKIKL